MSEPTDHVPPIRRESDQIEGTWQQQARFDRLVRRREARCSHYFAEADDTCTLCGREKP